MQSNFVLKIIIIIFNGIIFNYFINFNFLFTIKIYFYIFKINKILKIWKINFVSEAQCLEIFDDYWLLFLITSTVTLMPVIYTEFSI